MVNPLPFVLLVSVLYIPNRPFNLVSVRCLCCSLKCLVTFDEEFVTIQDQGMGRKIGIGRESYGLYHLPLLAPVTWSTIDDSLLIHGCLCHPSVIKLRKMVPY